MALTLAQSNPPRAARDPAVEDLAARLALAMAFPGAEQEASGAAPQLYRAVLSLFWNHETPAAHRHEIFEPLAEAVATHRTHRGQALCAALAAAIDGADAPAALDACRGLALLERPAPH